MTTEPSQPVDDLDGALDRWVAQGLIEREQARRILAAEHGGSAPGQEPTPAGPSLVTEALGYVGGVLVLVAAAVVVGRHWADLGVGGRLAVAFGAAAVLFAAGLALPRDGSAGGRLRAVSWLLCVATLAGGLGLLADEVLGLRGASVVLLAAGVTALVAAALWAWHRTVAQQAALLAALAVTAGAAAEHLPRSGQEDLDGLAVWGVGAVWMLLAWGHVVGARIAGYVLGGIVAVYGTMLVVSSGWGAWLAISWAVVLVVAGVVLRDLALLGVGAVATLVTVPAVLFLWFPDVLVAALALLALGAVLVVGALQTARRRRRTGPVGLRDLGTPRTAAAVAAVVGFGVALAVVLLGSG